MSTPHGRIPALLFRNLARRARAWETLHLPTGCAKRSSPRFPASQPPRASTTSVTARSRPMRALSAGRSRPARALGLPRQTAGAAARVTVGMPPRPSAPRLAAPARCLRGPVATWDSPGQSAGRMEQALTSVHGIASRPFSPRGSAGRGRGTARAGGPGPILHASKQRAGRGRPAATGDDVLRRPGRPVAPQALRTRGPFLVDAFDDARGSPGAGSRRAWV